MGMIGCIGANFADSFCEKHAKNVINSFQIKILQYII